jgi:hypothetical protein
MVAEQVVQPVAARCVFGDQVLVVESLEVAAGSVVAGALERGGGVGIEAGAGDQPEPAEQPLLERGQVLVGQVERGCNGQVLDTDQGQPVPGRCQVGGQAGLPTVW